MERWFADDRDVRTDPAIAQAILEFIRRHGAMSVAMSDRIIGCPHEEGIDYPDGACARSAHSGQIATAGPVMPFSETSARRSARHPRPSGSECLVSVDPIRPGKAWCAATF